MSGLKQFCRDLHKDCEFSPLLQSFAEIIIAREGGNQNLMCTATIDLRLLAGRTFKEEYLDKRNQQDSQELITLFLQYANQQILEGRFVNEISGSQTCVDKNFQMVIEVTKNCPEK